MKWYYSKKLKLYIDLEPLKISKRVKNKLTELNIEYDYDNEKNICSIDFDSTKLLLEALDAKMLTPKEYWTLYKEATDTNNNELLESLTSQYFAEPLDRIYISKNEYIDSPKVIGKYKYKISNIKKSKNKEYRPGWFLPNQNIDEDTCEPIKVSLTKNLKISEWKYWTPDLNVTDLDACFLLRGYVTSVGRPSFDAGIPVNSKQPKQLVRECRYKPLESILSSAFLNSIEEFLKGKVSKETIINSKEWDLFLKSFDNEIDIKKEKVLDMLGILNLKKKENFNIINYTSFLDYIHSLKETLKKNIDNEIIFIIGHRNPDTDTVQT